MALCYMRNEKRSVLSTHMHSSLVTVHGICDGEGSTSVSPSNSHAISYSISLICHSEVGTVGHFEAQVARNSSHSTLKYINLVLQWLIFLILKMEAIYSSETIVDFQWTTRRYIPQDRTLHDHVCENVKCYTKHR
jgi:hypothetical protein